MRLGPSALLLVAALLSGTSASAGTLSYSGRLSLANGAPVSGQVDLEVQFYRLASGGSPLLSAPLPFDGVALSSGIFQIDLALTPSDLDDVFGDGTQPVYLELKDVTHGKTYPRQRYNAVGLAARIPVDSGDFEFDSTGKLTLKVPPLAPASSGQNGYLTSSDWNSFNSKQSALGFTPLNRAGDSMTGVLAMGGQKITGVGAPTGTDDAATKGYVDGNVGGFSFNQAGAANGKVVKWNGSNFYLGADEEGSPGGGITSLNGIGGTSQSLILGSSGTAPNWTNNTTDTHTLNIPMASGPGVTAGLLAKTDYDAFAGKQAAITGSTALSLGAVTTANQAAVTVNAYGASANQTGEVRFKDRIGGEHVALRAPDDLAANVTYTLPPVPGANGMVLRADTNGSMSWTSSPVADATTATKGVVQLATDGGTTASTVVQATDARLTNSRAPTSHATSHQNGGSDEIATATATANAIPKADFGGTLSLGWLPANLTGKNADTIDSIDGSAIVQTSRTISTSTGLTGGGDLSSNRTLALDVNGLSAVGSAAVSDTLPLYDGSGVKKITKANLLSGYLTSESDPEVGANTTDYMPKWNGSALVAGSVYDSGTAIGIGTNVPAASAILDVASTSKGILPPRMTTAQIGAISSPAAGLTVFNTTIGQVQVYSGTAWTALGGGGALIGSFSSGAAVSNYSVVLTGAANSAPSLAGSVLTLPSNTSYFIVELWGAGGGGSGGGINGSPGAAGAGGNSCFGTNATACTSPILQSNGGAQGVHAATPAAGGSASGGEINISGGGSGSSEGVNTASGSNFAAGAAGGSSPRGGGGGHGGGISTTGGAGAAYGGGGGGGGLNGTVNTAWTGAGGGGGGYTRKQFTNPSGTYYYTVGTGGTAGTAGTSGTAGGAGGAGGISISAYTSGISVTAASAGSGTVNYLPVWTSATDLGNSPITASAGNVGIGTTSPQAALDVNGAMRLAKNSSQPFACDAAHDGSIALTSVYGSCVCRNGTGWVSALDGNATCNWSSVPIVKVGISRNWANGTYAKSCYEYSSPGGGYIYDGATGDGVYSIDPDGAGGSPAFSVFCDMTTAGGGWTLVAQGTSGSSTAVGTVRATPAYSPSHWKLADATINSLKSGATYQFFVESMYYASEAGYIRLYRHNANWTSSGSMNIAEVWNGSAWVATGNSGMDGNMYGPQNTGATNNKCVQKANVNGTGFNAVSNFHWYYSTGASYFRCADTSSQSNLQFLNTYVR